MALIYCTSLTQHAVSFVLRRLSLTAVNSRSRIESPHAPSGRAPPLPDSRASVALPVLTVAKQHVSLTAVEIVEQALGSYLLSSFLASCCQPLDGELSRSALCSTYSDKSLLDLLRARSLAIALTDTRRHTTLDVVPYNAGVSIDNNSQPLGLHNRCLWLSTMRSSLTGRTHDTLPSDMSF